MRLNFPRTDANKEAGDSLLKSLVYLQVTLVREIMTHRNIEGDVKKINNFFFLFYNN